MDDRVFSEKRRYHQEVTNYQKLFALGKSGVAGMVPLTILEFLDMTPQQSSLFDSVNVIFGE